MTMLNLDLKGVTASEIDDDIDQVISSMQQNNTVLFLNDVHEFNKEVQHLGPKGILRVCTNHTNSSHKTNGI